MAFEGVSLPEPIEYLDLEHQESIVLQITKYELGTTTIHPKVITPRHIRTHMEQNSLLSPPPPGTPITVRVPTLRVWGSRVDAASPMTYWDVSSKRLIADLTPRLYAAGGAPITVTLTAAGTKPTKRYSVEVWP